MERNLVISFKDLLWAELPELNPGDTPRDIKGYIERRVEEGSRKDALMTLASRMVVYQSGLEKGIPSPVEDVDLEAKLLDQSLTQLRLAYAGVDELHGLDWPREGYDGGASRARRLRAIEYGREVGRVCRVRQDGAE